MFLPLLLLLQDAPALETAIADARAKTAGDVPCRATTEEGEVVICKLRDADRYRVPFVAPGRQELPDQRVARLVGQRTEPECGQGAFMAHCGFVGASVSVGGRGLQWVERKLAP
ncbi:hypothetical protein FHS95_003596 [Sphingomonas naasensis]|uniref:Uncharacterized protein n=1 Tax=Sphingomonas naasensis TaxID=1344951 RepID=A0A4S1WH43_9SPHN|nr:hypothetical protein [Sphingomonas naasensis]NIJ21885.1 hypothetical protein [Sphingomonas naasensis]TGX42421.1 hypothetical protein E5A74_11300 [Sphingomonas naasensis]